MATLGGDARLAATEQRRQVHDVHLGVGIVEAAEVLVRGVGGEVGGVDVGEAPRRVDLADENLGERRKAARARRSNPEDGVRLQLSGHDRGELHRVCGVEDHDHLPTGTLGRADDSPLALGERKIVRGPVGVPIEALVDALGSAAPDDHDAAGALAAGDSLIHGRVKLIDLGGFAGILLGLERVGVKVERLAAGRCVRVGGLGASRGVERRGVDREL